MSRMDLNQDAIPAPTAEDRQDSGAEVIEAAERLKRAARRPSARRPEAASGTRHRRRPRRIETPEPEASPEGRHHASALESQAGWTELLPEGWSWWGLMAGCAALLLLGCSLASAWLSPPPAPVRRVAITWLPGPRLNEQVVLSWIHHFPGRDRLSNPSDYLLDQLATHLRSQDAVSEVRSLRLCHERSSSGRFQRSLCLEIGLRTPYLPGVQADGGRFWLDREGKVLPGLLPPPPVPRPEVRGAAQAPPQALAEAASLWRRLESSLEPGLVTSILLSEPVDELGNRGLVLTTRQGTRLIWGVPGEERFGVLPDDKVRDLIRTIQGQGDLANVAAINVRFKEAFYTLK